MENGAIFTGWSFGSSLAATGEVVFNTAMCGYQEALSDPSYTGQILVLTAPEIGNYGVNPEDVESRSIAVRGLVIRELARVPANYRAEGGLAAWLEEKGVPGIWGVDTRAIVRMLRDHGAMRGVIESDQSVSDRSLVDRARSAPPMSGCNLAAEVSPQSEGDMERESRSVAKRRRSIAQPCVSRACPRLWGQSKHLQASARTRLCNTVRGARSLAVCD